jgi:hypothetical protein
VTPAVLQHGTGNLALFLHVLGATTLFGALIALVTLALVTRRRAEPAPTARLLFRIWLLAVLPAYLLMRICAEWILSVEQDDIPKLGDKGWVGTGFVVADLGAVVLLAVGIACFFASRREGRGRATTIAGILGSVYIAALVVAWFAMSAKPGA